MTSPSLGIRSFVSTSTRSPVLQRGRVDKLEIVPIVGSLQALRLGFGARTAQRVGLRLAAPFRDGFREIGEQHSEPQPDRDLPENSAVVPTTVPLPTIKSRRKKIVVSTETISTQNMTGFLTKVRGSSLRNEAPDRRNDQRAVEDRERPKLALVKPWSPASRS